MLRSPSRSLLTLLIASIATQISCARSPTFECTTDRDCGATGARCEQTRYCSFATTECVSGWRYGKYASADWRNQCVTAGWADSAVNLDGATDGMAQDVRNDVHDSATDGAFGDVHLTDARDATVVDAILFDVQDAMSVDSAVDAGIDGSTVDAPTCGVANQFCCNMMTCFDNSRCTSNSPNGICSCITSLYAGRNHTCAKLRDGTAVCWGSGGFGQLGGVEPVTKGALRVFDPAQPVAEIAAGEAFSASRTISGAVLTIGQNDFGQLGNGSYISEEMMFSAARNAVAPLAGISQLSAGYYHACARNQSGMTQCWGQNLERQLGFDTGFPGTTSAPQAGWLSTGFALIAAGGYHTCAIGLSLSQTYCWGRGREGQLGRGAMMQDSFTPEVVQESTGGPLTAFNIAAGGRHNCALVGDVVKCWGDNSLGQAGGLTLGFSGTARPVFDPPSPWFPVKVVAGETFSCALTAPSAGGRVYCWGSNEFGQLGSPTPIGSNNLQTSPRLLNSPALMNVIDIVAGGEHICVLRENGQVMCWGKNDFGQLGVGTSAAHSPGPIQVSIPCP